jgi:hypothetical protein|nr:MAG TPA: hypothetical protein [Caudoviricetes sp.]
MKRSKNYNLPLPEGDDEMLIEQVSEGIEKLDEQLGTTDKSLKSVTTQLEQLKIEVSKLKNSIGNAYLKDVIESLSIEVIRKQYGGHSEYELYDIRCVGCRTVGGDYITNSGKYTTYGDRNYNCGDFVIAVNPDALVVSPVTAATLDNILYVGKSMPDAYTGFTILDYNDTHNWNIGSEEGFATYDTLLETIHL